MIKVVTNSQQQAPRGLWYLDPCAFHHLINNKDLFIKELYPKYLEFIIAGGQTLYIESIGTIVILLADRSSMKLKRVVYIPECDSNLILLRKLYESKITYIDNPNAMTLM